MKHNFYSIRKLLLRFLFSLLILTMSVTLANAQSALSKVGEDVKINVYPNPFSLFAFVEIHPDLLTDHNNLTFVLYNILGKEVKRISHITTTKVKITRNDLPDGKYIYEMKSESGTIKIGRLNIY